ncbi:transmembrane 4 L6 family member 4-like [Oncorhynchus masou masou]|uniref:transmembrane 4 L6 family member 4-like n=1 Tax=Oncorhynchus masou masou TaxID=90313 RepID=UPI00318452E0
MCSGSFAQSLGITFIPLAILCVLSNILLFFPGGLVADDNDHITKEVWYFGGIMGSGVLMFTSIIFAAVGVLGAGYSIIVSAVAIHNGPIDYLNNHTLWKDCTAPEGIVTWHLTLFSMLLVMGLLQAVLCAIQVINGLIGAICGDCCGRCGSTDGAV